MARNFIGLRTIIYHVADLEAATRWYTRVAGVEPYFSEPFYVGFNVGGFELGLDPNPESGTGGTGGTTAYWGVADVGAALADLVAAGATVRSPATEVGEGIWVGSVLDPFGNEIGVIQNPLFRVADVR